jgi:hypothetical protein
MLVDVAVRSHQSHAAEADRDNDRMAAAISDPPFDTIAAS